MSRLRILSLAVIGALCTAAFLLAAASDTAVADEAMNGNVDAVRTLLKNGADVNAPQGDGMTALHWAAYKDNLELTRMLIYAGAKISAVTRINGYTPLFLAAQNGNAPIIETLLKAGADANSTLSTGTTPLMFAARSGNPEAVKVLLDNGANVNAWEMARGQTALMFAAANNRAEVIRVLLERGANPSISSKIVDIAARNAARGGRGRGQGRGAGPAAPAQGGGEPERPPRIDAMGGMKALHLAARQGHLEAVDALVAGGADINEVNPGDRTTPLLVATINGHYDLAKFMLEKGANPKLASSAGATPLYTAINVKWAPRTDYPQPDAPRLQKTSYLDLMKAFVDRGADVNARLRMELWYTGYNFDLSQVNAAGATAFWRAAQAGDVAAMRLLLAAGADPTIKNNDGTSPLHVAAGAGVHGNDEVTAPGGWMAGLKYMVEELKLDVNEIDGQGFTAMHHAAARGDNEMILFLVSNGARVDIVGKNGQTTADMANGPRQRIQPFGDTIALLVSLGAKNNNRCVSC